MMKKIIATCILMAFALVGFSQKYDSFGKKIKAKNAQSMEVLSDLDAIPSNTVKIQGEVVEVCQKMGCFMQIKTVDGKTMRVKFKDYGFFVPKDIAGKTVIFEGVPTVAVTSVEQLKHYAEDANKSQEEIDKITEPKTELTFEAIGVLVPKD